MPQSSFLKNRRSAAIRLFFFVLAAVVTAADLKLGTPAWQMLVTDFVFFPVATAIVLLLPLLHRLRTVRQRAVALGRLAGHLALLKLALRVALAPFTAPAAPR
jgi:hypothetical protein